MTRARSHAKCVSEQQHPEQTPIVSSARPIDNFNGIAYDPVHGQAQNVPTQNLPRNPEIDYIDYKHDDDQSMANGAADAVTATVSNTPTVGNDFVDNVSTSDPYASTSCLRKRITTNARKSSPKMHCNKSPSSASTCEFVQPATTMSQASAGHDRGMATLHRPQFASGAKLKKIVFNGTFPIDDPYSSRFDYNGLLLQ